MSESQRREEREGPPALPAAEEVEAFLRRHPDFIRERPELLEALELPHPTPQGVVSLIERQVAVLRRRNRELEQQLQALVQVARENDRLNERMQRLTVALLEAESLGDLLSALHESLVGEFKADGVSLRLFRPAPPRAEALEDLVDLAWDARDGAEAAELGTLLRPGARPLCGPLRHEQYAYLFGPRAEAMGSAAVLPLTAPPAPGLPPQLVGLLAVGSADPRRYHAGMGTLFLAHLGRVVGRALARHLPPSALEA